MNIFIDTNILFDFVFRRQGFYEDAFKIFALAENKDNRLFVSALSIINGVYVAKRYNLSLNAAKTSFKEISSFVNIVDLKGKTVTDCLNMDWKDYEDSTQYITALSINADVIITRNNKDFVKSTIPTKLPSEFFLR